MKAECIGVIENSMIYNDIYSLKKVDKAVEYLQKTSNLLSNQPKNIINSLIEKQLKYPVKDPENIKKLLVENKFLDIKWEILFDDSSSKVQNISQIKILVKIEYMNYTTLEKKNFTLLLSESEFNEMFLELSALQKNF